MLFSLICFEGDLSSHYSANELCLVALTLYLVWSSESPTSGVFILKATIWNCFLLIRIAWLCRSLCFKSVHDICFTKFVVSILFRLFSLNMCKDQDLSTLQCLHPFVTPLDIRLLYPKIRVFEESPFPSSFYCYLLLTKDQNLLILL